MTTSNMKAIIPCDIDKVWETVSTVENYPTWRRDVSKTEVLDEKQFIECTKDGYSTEFTVTVAEPRRRWEFDMENDQVKGHRAYAFESKGNETEIDFTASVTAKKLNTRPVGKGAFENVYLKKEQEQFLADLKKLLNC